MAIRYVDASLSTGNNDGSSQANAWHSLQEAIDDTGTYTLVAGDTCLCRHTQSPDETLTVPVDIDGSSGTADAFIQFIGVNSSWVEDGTKYEISGGGVSDGVLNFSGAAVYYTLWKHFVLTNSVGNGVNFMLYGPAGHVFIDCVLSNNTGSGYVGYRNANGMVLGCLAYGNGTGGFYVNGYTKTLFCCSRDNAGYGFYAPSQYRGVFYNCLAFDNSGKGYDIREAGNLLLNCVSDSNAGENISITGANTALIGCRITNAATGAYGLDANSKMFMSMVNYYQSNAAGNKLAATNEVFLNMIDSTDTSQYDQGDTDAGYQSLTEGSENYELSSDATMFETAIQIPVGQA